MSASSATGAQAPPTPMEEFWGQSWGKAVSEVTTILGAEPQPTGRTVPGGRSSSSGLARVENCPVGGSVDLPVSAEDQLAAAAASAVLTRRVAAVDRYVLHRAYPSPRALFGVDLELHRADGSREVVLPWDGAVLGDEGRHSDEPGEATTFQPGLVARVRPGRYPAPYGSLRPSLARLEAGHLLATVAVVAEHLGLRPTTVLGGPADQAGASTVDVPVEGVGLTLPRRSVADLVQAATSGSDVATIREWFAWRTSGPSGANLITSYEPDPEVVERLDDVIALTLRAVQPLCPPGAMTVHRTQLRGRGMSDRTVASVGSDGPTSSRALAATAPWTSALGYTWSIDPLAWEHEHQAVSSGAIHVLLGWLCQWACLTAAGHGVAARPVRNIDEGLWANDLQLAGRSMPGYQLWIRPLTTYDQAELAWNNHGRPA